MSAAGLRYNEVRQKSIHNAFQRHEGIPDQFLYWRIRSMEVDLHRTDFFGDEIRDDWAVYHDWHDPISTVARFSQVLQHLSGLNRVVPEHEVLTLFVDIKDPFSARSNMQHSWRMLDELIEAHLGDRVFRPRDLLDTAPAATSLRAAVESAGWPLLEQLRGRFLVVLTGSNEQLGNYARGKDDALDRVAFLSTPVDRAADIPGMGDTLFFNINSEKNMHLVERVHPLGFIARAYYVNSPDAWKAAIAADCHHIATDKVNERIDGWPSTRNSSGYPFARIDRKRIDAAEGGAVCGVWARSQDMWGQKDDFVFCFNTHSAARAGNTLGFAIASPNSHTEHFTKGAVLARADLEADAAYVGVVRTGQKHGLRVQFRRRKGGPTVASSPSIGGGGLWGRDFDQDTLVHVRLTVAAGGRSATAAASIDCLEWVDLGTIDVEEPLVHQGIGVSSHGQRRGAKFLFVSPGTAEAPVFAETTFIGDEAEGACWVDWTDRGRWRTRDFSAWKP